MDIMETQMDACTSYCISSFIQTKKPWLDANMHVN